MLSARHFSLGYFYPLIQISLYGIFLGTDSFTISKGIRIFPSLGLFAGAGFYEFTAYVLFAASTAKFTLWNQTGWLSGNLEKIKTRHDLRLKKSEVLTLILAIVLLLVAAMIEAIGIITH